MNSLVRYRAQIDAANEYAWLELFHDRITDVTEELAAGYGPNKANIPDLVGAAIERGQQMSSNLWLRMCALDRGEE